MAESPLLQVSGLDKRFGRVVVAEEISFDVREGEALGIVGPNGAGKSSLLSLITGVLPVDAGRITYAGREVTKASAESRARLGIARSFQIPRPFVDMTVFENAYVAAAFAGGIHGQAGHRAAYESLERTGLAHLANTPAGQLRLLDRKRLELARALATGPQLILLDEIAGGLTERELPPLVDLIRDLRAQGLTVVWIEHIVHALVAVVDRLMCLAAGRILAIGDPADVMKRPEVIEVYLGTTFDLGQSA